MLALCREARIRELHHVSTAYVCGSRQGRIFESELDEGQDCRNEYEASKLEAERLVRGPDGLESVTVYRPAVISGDSKTGYTSTYHGLYLYLRLMAMAVPMQPAGEGRYTRDADQAPNVRRRASQRRAGGLGGGRHHAPAAYAPRRTAGLIIWLPIAR